MWARRVAFWRKERLVQGWGVRPAAHSRLSLDTLLVQVGSPPQPAARAPRPTHSQEGRLALNRSPVFSHTLPHLVYILVETGPSCCRTQTPLTPGGLPGPCVRSKPCSTDSFHRGGSRGTENQVPLGRPSSLSLTRWGPVSSVADGPVLPRPPPSSPGECGLWEWNSCQQQVPRGAGHSL